MGGGTRNGGGSGIGRGVLETPVRGSGVEGGGLGNLIGGVLGEGISGDPCEGAWSGRGGSEKPYWGGFWGDPKWGGVWDG